MKRADVSFQVVVLVLIVLMIIISLSVAFMLFLSPGGFRDRSIDAFCSISTSGRHFTQLLGGHLFPEFCKTRPKTISASDWDECPYYKAQIEERKDFKGNEKDYHRNCAAEQFAKLMVKCWSLRGKGEANPGSFECFTVCFSSDEAIDRAKAKLATAQNNYDEVHNEYEIKKNAAEDALAQYGENSDEYKLARWKLEQVPTSKEDAEAEEERDEAQKEFDGLNEEGVPIIALNLEDIKRVMKEATIEGEGEVTYSDILPVERDNDRLYEMDFWDNIIEEKNIFRRFKWTEGKINNGQVVSIYFIDDMWDIAPFGLKLVKFGRDMIKVRYKTLC